MKLSVEFPSVSYREGPDSIIKLAQGIEAIGFDQIDMFDHVIMGYPTESRSAPQYPSKMPIMETLMILSFISARTRTIGLGTEVLILPQRQPVLVAKQVSTLDTLSNGRMRLGVGVGWQESEYEMLEESFTNRGRRMDECIRILRKCWSEETINYDYRYYSSEAMAMEPKSPQAGNLPIWVGGGSDAALRRVGELGDGWLANATNDGDVVKSSMAAIRGYAEAAGRDPDQLGWQMMLQPPPNDAAGKMFYQDVDRVKTRADEVRSWGFEYIALNATAIFQAGARTVDAILNELARLHEALRSI